MSLELERELRLLQHGQHLCLLYDSTADCWATLVPFFKEGLARGERCIFGECEDPEESARVLLARAGIGIEREEQRGSIRITTDGRSGFLGGHFEVRAELDLLEALDQQALSDGFTGVRFSAEMPSSPRGELYRDVDLLEFEARVNEVISRHKIIGICRYDLRRWPAALLQKVLVVHPKAVIGPLVCPNTYYEPLEMALGHCPQEERVRWMMDQICRARSDKLALEQAIQARDDFLSAASHELRTPLTSAQLLVSGVLRRLENAVAGGDQKVSPSWVIPKVEVVDRQLRKLVDVIEERLAAYPARPDDCVKFNLEPVDLGNVVGEVVGHFDDQVKQARCTLHFDPPPDPVVGRWDRIRLEQVASNLLSNAIKFGQGGLIELRVYREGAEARLVVRDHGVGIAAADLQRIFGRFERAVPITQYGGFGLGLWIVKKIVEGLGGHVTATSVPGAGSTFTVQLPLR
jgi:nitrogen-specific signal transduction histidine kinase